MYITDENGNYIQVVVVTGNDGKEVELRVNGNYIQWRREDTEWYNLTTLDALQGVPGKRVLLNAEEYLLQYKYEGDTEWIDLVDLSEYFGNTAAATAAALANAAATRADTAAESCEGIKEMSEEFAAAEIVRERQEAARQDAESSRVNVEKTRVSAETARVDAEKARATAEGNRASAETSRASAESTRQTQEQARQTNTETAIQSANTATTRANTAAEACEEIAGGKPQSHADTHASGGTDPVTPESIGAAESAHTHGNLTSDGKIGTAANRAIYTNTGGLLRAGTLPIAGGGTGASTAANARTTLGAQATKLSFTDVGVAVDSWVANTTYADYPYCAAVACAGVTESMFPELVLAPSDATSGNFAPVCDSYAGGIYLYATAIPEAALTIPVIVVFP